MGSRGISRWEDRSLVQPEPRVSPAAETGFLVRVCTHSVVVTLLNARVLSFTPHHTASDR